MVRGDSRSLLFSCAVVMAILPGAASGCAGPSAHQGSQSAAAVTSDVAAGGITEVVVCTPGRVYWLGADVASERVRPLVSAVLAAPAVSPTEWKQAVSDAAAGPGSVIEVPFPKRRLETRYEGGIVVLLRDDTKGARVVHVLVIPRGGPSDNESLQSCRTVTPEVESAWRDLEEMLSRAQPRTVPGFWGSRPVLLDYVRETFVDQGVRAR